MRPEEVLEAFELVSSEREPGFVTIETRGLSRHSRSELQLFRVPAGCYAAGRGFVTEVAAYTLLKKEVNAGETIQVPTHFGSNFARAVSAASSVEPALDAPLLRLIDRFADDGASVRLILATELLEESQRATRSGDDVAALRLLDASIEVYPGAPNAEEGAPNFNTENYRAYVARFAITERPADLRAALERCMRFQLEQLGGLLAQVSTLLADRDAVGKLAALHVTLRLDWAARAREGRPLHGRPTLAMLQPIVHWGLASKRLEAEASFVPARWDELFDGGAARAAIETDESIDLIADACAHHASYPEVLLALTADSGQLWETTAMERLPIPAPFDEPVPGAVLITRVMAHVAMLAAWGVPHAERRAWFLLDGRDGAEERLRARVRELAHRHTAMLVGPLAKLRQRA